MFFHASFSFLLSLLLFLSRISFRNKSEKLNSLCKNRIITSLLKIVNVMISSRCCTCLHVICGWHSLIALHTLKSLYWWIQFYHQVTQSSTSPFFSFKHSTLISVSSLARTHTLCAVSLHAFFASHSFIHNILFTWCLHMHDLTLHTLHLQRGSLSFICFPYWWETDGEMGGDMLICQYN